MQASGLRRRAAVRRDEHLIDRESRSEQRTEQLEPLVGVLIVVIVALLLARPLFRVVTVHDYERGLRYRRGRFSGLVDPGTHITLAPLTEIHVLDGRPSFVTIEGQEVLTADGVPLKVSLAARYVVGDPVAAVTGDQSYGRALHLELQLGLREVLSAGTVDDILSTRNKIGPAVLEHTASKLAKIGIELLSVEVRDLMMPGDLKRVFAGVVAARKEGEAGLERVRGETAALRNLANAGRMVEENPGLLQLRVLQHLGGSSGNTVMLSMPDGQGSASPTPAPATRARSASSQRATSGTKPPSKS
jgi:regulator of protease activity HflC (stomatin/prohibitin superfamily)